MSNSSPTGENAVMGRGRMHGVQKFARSELPRTPINPIYSQVNIWRKRRMPSLEWASRTHFIPFLPFSPFGRQAATVFAAQLGRQHRSSLFTFTYFTLGGEASFGAVNRGTMRLEAACYSFEMYFVIRLGLSRYS